MLGFIAYDNTLGFKFEEKLLSNLHKPAHLKCDLKTKQKTFNFEISYD